MKLQIWTWQLIKGNFNFKIVKFNWGLINELFHEAWKSRYLLDSTTQPSNIRPLNC